MFLKEFHFNFESQLEDISLCKGNFIELYTTWTVVPEKMLGQIVPIPLHNYYTVADHF
jgi:hypothetical protein